jgi:hypothetical protein
MSVDELLYEVCTEKLNVPPLPAGGVREEREERAILECVKDARSKNKDLSTGDSFAEQAFRVATALPWLWLLAWLLGPPLVVLVLGASIVWALLGFRKPNSVQ